MDLLLYIATAVKAHIVDLRHRAEERGEGVISAAIAVLIVAALGVGAFATFQRVFNNAGNAADRKVTEITN